MLLFDDWGFTPTQRISPSDSKPKHNYAHHRQVDDWDSNPVEGLPSVLLFTEYDTPMSTSSVGSAFEGLTTLTLGSPH